MVAYQNGIMDAITDPAVTFVTVKKSARVGYTKILDHVVGYFIHQDPSPILMVQPRVEDAEDYSKTEVSPMLRDTPVLDDVEDNVVAGRGMFNFYGADLDREIDDAMRLARLEELHPCAD